MTLWGKDASDFDATVSYTNLGFFTHKATEGIHTIHHQYGPRLNAAKAAGVPVLGSYHVLRTPNANNGTLEQQLRFWVSRMDSETPWWRTHPHWMLQIDAEKWPYDAVSANTVLQFAALLVDSGLPGWAVTYASRTQFGDSLRGIRTPLWNANYSGSSGGSYPGDDWTPGWAPYSGQTPALLQYTSTPHDSNAFRGTLDQFLALLTGAPAPALEDDMYLVELDDGLPTANGVWKSDGFQCEPLADWATGKRYMNELGWKKIVVTPDEFPKVAGKERVEVNGADPEAVAAAIVAKLPPALAQQVAAELAAYRLTRAN